MIVPLNYITFCSTTPQQPFWKNIGEKGIVAVVVVVVVVVAVVVIVAVIIVVVVVVVVVIPNRCKCM